MTSLRSFNLGDYNLSISPQGLSDLVKNYDPKNPQKNFIWTTDPRVELPVLQAKEGAGSLPALTVFDMWNKLLLEYSSRPAISDKVNGKWITLTYKQYHEQIIKFALGLIRLGISERSAVSILGFNCSNWFIDFYGAIFANCIACGHYLTNSPDAIKYVIEHSDSEFFVAENQEQLNKVLEIWDKTPILK